MCRGYDGNVLSIGTRELRSALADHIRRAGAGERFVITVDRNPVAQLGPIETPSSGPLSLDDAANVGLVRRPAAGPVDDGAIDKGAIENNPGAADAPGSAAFAVDTRVDRILRQVRG